MDNYHETTPPTELKSVVLGRDGSKKTHGGARKGAGRPPLPPRPQALQAVTVRIEPGIAERFRKLAQSHQRSQAKQFAAMVEDSNLT